MFVSAIFNILDSCVVAGHGLKWFVQCQQRDDVTVQNVTAVTVQLLNENYILAV